MKIFRGKPVIVTRPDGSEIEYASQTKASKSEPVTQSQFSLLCRGYSTSINGYKARFKTPTSNDITVLPPEPHSQLKDTADESYF